MSKFHPGPSPILVTEMLYLLQKTYLSFVLYMLIGIFNVLLNLEFEDLTIQTPFVKVVRTQGE